MSAHLRETHILDSLILDKPELGRTHVPPMRQMLGRTKPISWNSEVNALIIHLGYLRETVQIENQEGNLERGDITAYVNVRFAPLLEKLVDKLNGVNSADLEQRLDQAGYPFVAMKGEAPRLYLTQQQFITFAD